MTDIKFSKALAFVKKHHRGQYRAARVPAWLHLFRVALRLRAVLEETREGTKDDRIIIVRSALGHDLLEDTKASESAAKKIFGERGMRYIRGMTNSWGDQEKARYIQQIVRSEEEVRLIKLSDLYDNITSVVHTLPLLGKKWTESYFLPIVEPAAKAVLKTPFRRYRKAAFILAGSVERELALLRAELKEFYRKN